MKKVNLIILLVLLTSCSNLKKNNDSNQKESAMIAKNTFLSCPNDGICQVEKLENKNIIIKQDDLNGIYYHTEDNNNFSIIKFTYTRNTEKEIQDNSYVEEIIFQIQNDAATLNLLDSELETVNMLFGKHCFCKGEAGYYKVANGRLDIKKENNQYHLKFDFQISATSHVVKTIDVVIK
ncbi:conserved exported hypothetical protein [Flavobacterium sp. 9AF]|uniref:hypothetical protein n=1 Tax=Flavobacterium sp. 9AF TaxID=2653142 RepID=UPI0012F2C9A4|nr:hypothetical protein [Flavobacterium sp. 9AF]VXB43064.1 conserved exported hypothetical protein [Flavobacterium sp. 9AF]